MLKVVSRPANMFPTTPKRACPEIPPSFTSPPPSSPAVGLPFSSPSDPTRTPGHTGSGLWTAAPGSAGEGSIRPFPLRLLELTPDPFMSPDHRVTKASHGKSGKRTGKGVNSIRYDVCQSTTTNSDSAKRGRPRADMISNLIIQGSSSPSEIKCKICHRVFPREKSLQVK